jgi:hypothetical protein
MLKPASRPIGRSLLWALACLSSVARTQESNPAGVDFFEKHVRPLFAQHCLECHGEKKQEMNLRFDNASALRHKSEAGPIIVPGQPDQSPLLAAVRHAGDLQMPPDAPLPDDAVRAIEEWIRQGAPWPASEAGNTTTIADQARQHWAFQPLVRPAIPSSTSAADGPIDAFLLERLADKGLDFSPKADARTLLRRASYDMIGLPPSEDEITAFENDHRPDAHARLADRLLASPQHGERWARHWMDVARYADTKGYVFTAERRYPFAYTYRDYLIRSFNEDLPYDRFVREQIAADRLASSDPAPLAAMGYLTVGRRFLNNRHDILDDRIDVVSRGFLGLTVTCARCHDHKYDPISMADYYGLYGIFASSDEPEARPTIGNPNSESLARDYQQQLSQLQAGVDSFIDHQRRNKEKKFRAQLPKLLVAWHDCNGNADDPKIDQTARDIGLSKDMVQFFFQRWQAFLQPRLEPQHPVFGVLAIYKSAADSQRSPMAGQLRERLASEPTMSQTMNPIVLAKFQQAEPNDMKAVVERYAQILTDPSPETADIRRVLDEPGSPVKLSADDALRLLDQTERDKLNQRRTKIAELRSTHEGSPAEAMVLTEGAVYDAKIFLRGNPDRPGPPVTKQYLRSLDAPDAKPFTNGSGRLELADKIASPDNPLTPRVMVNRLWHWHFGRGLVRSTSDFGLRSDPPTHPLLLDYLAHEFIHAEWSMKAIHRQILESAAYRQSSLSNGQGSNSDPENDLLWSYRRRRLSLEEMRDTLLFVTGELDTRVLGRSVPIIGTNPSRRRAVYAYIDRQNLEGFFRTFDFANPNTSVPLRFATTVPQQALFLLNSPFVHDRSRQLADDPQLNVPSTEHRLENLYRRILGRRPDADEMSTSQDFLHAESMRAPSGPDPQNPWEKLAHTLLISNEVAFVD